MTHYKSFILFTLQFILALPFSSCMHTMMMGGHSEHDGHTATKVTKEVTNNHGTLSVTIDPMKVGTESNIVVSVTSISALPESMDVHYMISKNSDTVSHSAHNHETSTASKSEFATIHADAAVKNGKLLILFTPTVAGGFVFSIETDSISTEIPFTVAEEKSSGMGGMMGISSGYWYLGAIAMTGMMVMMLTIKGGIL